MPAAVFLPLASSLLTATGAPLAIAGVDAGLALGSASLASTLSSITLSTAAIGASYALQLLNQPKPKSNPGQIQSRQSLPARRVVFGLEKVAGPLFFLAIGGDGAVYRGSLLSEGPIEAVLQIWLADTDSGVVGGSGANTALPWLGAIGLESGLGAAGQGASSALSAGFTEWTAAHTLDGIAWLVMKAAAVKPKYFQKVYPSFIPQERAVLRGIKVMDVRSGVAVWSENPANLIYHVMTHPRQGLGIPHDAIDLQSFRDFATLCDETVRQFDGSFAQRYGAGGSYELIEAPKDVLGKLLATCDGEIFLGIDGRWSIGGGQHEAATFTIGDEMITAIHYEGGAGKLEAFNRLKISYTSPLHDFQQVETTSWDNTESIARGEIVAQDLSLPFVRNHSQARRLAKITMYKGNPHHRIKLTCNVRALPARAHRRIRLQSRILGIDDEFRRGQFIASGDLSTITVMLESLPAAAYGWETDVEEGPPPAVPSALANTAVYPDPTNLHLTPTIREISPGVSVTLLRLTEDVPAGEWASFGGRIKRATGGTFRRMASDGDWALISQDPVEVQDYVVVEAANAGSAGFDEAGNLIADGSSYVAPAAVAEAPVLAPIGVSGGVATMTWTNPGATDFWAVRIYRVDTVPAVMVGQVFQWPAAIQSFTDPDTTPGVRYYALRSVSPVNVESANSNVQGVVV